MNPFACHLQMLNSRIEGPTHPPSDSSCRKRIEKYSMIWLKEQKEKVKVVWFALIIFQGLKSYFRKKKTGNVTFPYIFSIKKYF